MAANVKRTRQIFVAYPYNLFDGRDYRRVFTNLEEPYKVKFIFADEKILSMHILQKIRLYIEVSDFSLFDISGWNANVALELGVAYALDRRNWYILFNPKKNAAKEVPSNIRGLDRIQYDSFTQLGERLTLLLAQWYPPDEQSPLDSYSEEMQAKVLRLLAESQDGLGIVDIASGIRVQTEMAQVIVRQLTASNKVRQKGRGRGTRYYIK